MRPDELSLQEQLVASTAVAGYRKAGMPTNGTPALVSPRHDQHNSATLERVLINGDLSQLSPADRIGYYRTVCESLNLNPLTKPFEYITLNDKLTLYAKRDCTDQLRFRDHISIHITARDIIDDIYVVTAHACTPDGREDESTGAVSIAGLKGEAKANAYLKAETKSKRRVTLSICGLGLLDETEVESIPGARPPREIAVAEQQQVAERKIAELREQQKPMEFPPAEQAWSTKGQFREVFVKLRELAGEVEYNRVLDEAGVAFASHLEPHAARHCYDQLVTIIELGAGNA